MTLVHWNGKLHLKCKNYKSSQYNQHIGGAIHRSHCPCTRGYFFNIFYFSLSFELRISFYHSAQIVFYAHSTAILLQIPNYLNFDKLFIAITVRLWSIAFMLFLLYTWSRTTLL